MGNSVASFFNFYSHAPRGARHQPNKQYLNGLIFLLTRPSRGATKIKYLADIKKLISTHTPLAGRDRFRTESGETLSISTHTPLAGRDRTGSIPEKFSQISTHTPLAGRD